MRYKLLGHSGLRVSELCLGTMTFGDDWGWGGSYDESRKMFDAFAEVGGNFIDTANLYTNGTSEKYVGEFVKSDRDKWVIATKYSLNMGNGGMNAVGNHRKNMVQAVEASLKRLDLEYIDLLWLHAWDSTTPVEEVMRSFDDLVRQGKVLYIGVSDTPAWIISQANMIAQWRGWTPFVGLQIEYSLKERTSERDLLPMARAFDIGVTAWSPLGAGVLTGKYNKPEAAEGRLNNPNTSRPVSERDISIAQVVLDIAAEIEETPSQVALNWIRQQPGGIIPIIGSRKLTQLQENMACLDFQLTPEQLQRLDQVSAIAPGFPHDFLQSDQAQNFAFGGTIAQIDNHRG
ncbi:MAG: aldo/keto reductase [Myxacorys chilensis ATA2-1-KO14]|jgi:aryl-alcohol dehydrogenase-like predicted oxidoreductase|nr:aldo/keto reductase [Myxacorys chilensis ATA2-1-KO14]